MSFWEGQVVLCKQIDRRSGWYFSVSIADLRRSDTPTSAKKWPTDPSGRTQWFEKYS